MNGPCQDARGILIFVVYERILSGRFNERRLDGGHGHRFA